MDYNKSYIYNYPSASTGAYYNSSSISILINISETLRFSDDIPKIIAVSILKDNIKLSDYLYNYVFNINNESCKISDSLSFSALVNLVEKTSIKEQFYNVLVYLYLSENEKIIDQLKSIDALIKEEEFQDVSEDLIWEALIDLAESENLEDAKYIFASILKNEPLPIIDRDPRKAISDFLIGKTDEFDSAYDWIFPFDMKVDWRSSSIQVMPQTESTYIDIPGNDGSIIENTIYKNRIFSIVAFSELGLSIYEKEQLKQDICQILDETKNNPKKLTFQNSDTSFDVIYSGSATITEGPSYVKAVIPFETSPYGYPTFEQEVYGSGLLINDGDCDAACINKISSGCVNPSFTIGTITYYWDGTVPDDSTLIIDHNNYTCYIETVEGTRTNALDKLTGDFQSIPRKTSVAITALGETGEFLYTSLKEKIIW